MKPVIVDEIFVVAEGLINTVDLDAEAPHKFVCCYPCDANGDPVVASSGTVVYEVLTRSCPFWVDIEANGDWAAMKDSSFQSPATKLRVTVSAQDVAVTHYRVVGVQYYG